MRGWAAISTYILVHNIYIFNIIYFILFSVKKIIIKKSEKKVCFIFADTYLALSTFPHFHSVFASDKYLLKGN